MRRRSFIAAVGGAATWPAARDVCAERPVSTGGTFTFRTSITCAVTLFMVALAGLLIAIQTRALDLATREAASAYMDAASTKAVGRLQTEIATIASLVRVLATSSSVTDTDQRTLTGPAIPLFKTALKELPQWIAFMSVSKMARGCRCVRSTI